VLEENGGVYVDADCVWLGADSFDELVQLAEREAMEGGQQHAMLVAEEDFGPDQHAAYRPNGLKIANNLFAASPHHPLVKRAIALVPERMEQMPPVAVEVSHASHTRE
jgi:hypothetical protein